jgi:hypothetical protein
MQRRIYNEPTNEAEALATCQRLLQHYERIQAIIPGLQMESHDEWEDDAVDILYKAQTVLMHAAAELAKNFDLVVIVIARPGQESSEAPAPPTPSTPTTAATPAKPEASPEGEEDVMTTANRLIHYAEEISGLVAKIDREDKDSFDSDPIDQLFKAKESLLEAAIGLSLDQNLTLRVVKPGG